MLPFNKYSFCKIRLWVLININQDKFGEHIFISQEDTSGIELEVGISIEENVTVYQEHFFSF